ncbi:PAS domain-containing protein [Pigmentiphaga aceris]|uniref:histidine kinase n=1 Tax=Pigmentiphaga aceris TaxID=1940612 RepID=A0A5C0B238_9BURK|nr:ATP-binding protein [Pigmentiphaga aceris]QEI07240.1 PAS domain-containing protein [Pigmentiphaga aceris]
MTQILPRVLLHPTADADTLRRAFTSLPVIAWMIDINGRHVFVTDSYAKLFAKSADECIGVSVGDLWPPMLGHAYALRNQQMMTVGARKRFEEMWPVGDEPRWFEIELQCVVDDQGRAEGVSGFAQDITSRIERQEAARRNQIDLERKFAKRTAELQASNEELEAFSYSVSHDLRAPLRAVEGFTDLLREDYGPQLDEMGQDYLSHIVQGTHRMSRLINDLIALAKMNQSELERQRVDLSHLVREIVADLRARDPQREVVVNIAENISADCDVGLMNAALENLLGNAWKFSSKIPDARIEFGSFARSSSTVYFVRDNGAGFDMGHASRLFAAFQRFHHERDFTGTGIGLATVKRIIRRHGGQVWAESAPGQGATFYFTLDMLG